MNEQLKEKLNDVGIENIPYWEHMSDEDKESYFEAFKDVYDLAKSESKESIIQKTLEYVAENATPIIDWIGEDGQPKKMLISINKQSILSMKQDIINLLK